MSEVHLLDENGKFIRYLKVQEWIKMIDTHEVVKITTEMGRIICGLQQPKQLNIKKENNKYLIK